MKAIAIATVDGKCLMTLAASIISYVPEDVVVYLAGSEMKLPRHKTVNLLNEASNFGDAFNSVMNRAFQDVDEVVCCNDDIVFNPYTWDLLAEDVSLLKREKNSLGWVACRSDYARGYQNIRIGQGRMQRFKYETEHKILTAEIIAPICAYIHKDAWVDFPPLNWYSDDVQCLDVMAKGCLNYISRAYVHHVGSQTCGFDAKNLIESAKPWIRENRPELYKEWFQRTD